MRCKDNKACFVFLEKLKQKGQGISSEGIVGLCGWENEKDISRQFIELKLIEVS